MLVWLLPDVWDVCVCVCEILFLGSMVVPPYLLESDFSLSLIDPLLPMTYVSPVSEKNQTPTIWGGAAFSPIKEEKYLVNFALSRELPFKCPSAPNADWMPGSCQLSLLFLLSDLSPSQKVQLLVHILSRQSLLAMTN